MAVSDERMVRHLRRMAKVNANNSDEERVLQAFVDDGASLEGCTFAILARFMALDDLTYAERDVFDRACADYGYRPDELKYLRAVGATAQNIAREVLTRRDPEAAASCPLAEL